MAQVRTEPGAGSEVLSPAERFCAQTMYIMASIGSTGLPAEDVVLCHITYTQRGSVVRMTPGFSEFGKTFRAATPRGVPYEYTIEDVTQYDEGCKTVDAAVESPPSTVNPKAVPMSQEVVWSAWGEIESFDRTGAHDIDCSTPEAILNQQGDKNGHGESGSSPDVLHQETRKSFLNQLQPWARALEWICPKFVLIGATSISCGANGSGLHVFSHDGTAPINRANISGRTASSKVAIVVNGPYVNVLKAFPLHDEENCKCQGDVTEEIDKGLGVRIIRIYGTIAANNFLQIPHGKGRQKSLGLKDSYIYMQVKALQSRHFVIHMDISTIEKLTVRATFSNMIKEPKNQRHNAAECTASTTWVKRQWIMPKTPEAVNVFLVSSLPHAEGIWHVTGESPFCAAILQCPSLVEIRVFRFDSQCRCMVVAGVDTQRRQQLQIWDLSRLRSEGHCSLLARQVSDFDVTCIKFSPFDEFCLISCGNENIRFWRIKNSHLPGCSVVLEAAARANCYTDLDFECSRTFQTVHDHTGERWLAAARVFFSSTSGCVAQVDYVSRRLQRVYKLHAAPIWSLSVSDAFCATASEDGFVRVWPLTFQSCFMHVKNEAAAVGVDGSEDGLQLLCTAADGSVGILNIGSQHYQPLLRTHARPIRDAAVSEAWRELYTVSTDRSVRIWSLPDLHEAFEFQSSVDRPTRVACHPLERVLAVGFDSGALRVFDIDTKPPQVILEARHHLHSIRGIYFVRNSARDHRESHVEQSRCLLVTADSSGVVSIHDERLEYQLTQRAENPGVHPPPEDIPPLAFSPDGAFMARYFDGCRVCCFAFPSLLYKAKVCLPRTVSRASSSLSMPYTAPSKHGKTAGGARITAYGFAASGHGVLVVCSSNSMMRFYDLGEAMLAAWQVASYMGRRTALSSDSIRLSRGIFHLSFASPVAVPAAEIPLMSGAITAALVTHFDLESHRYFVRAAARSGDEGPFDLTNATDNAAGPGENALPQIALTTAEDNIVKLWNLDVSACQGLRQPKHSAFGLNASLPRTSRPCAGVPGAPPSARACSLPGLASNGLLPPLQSFSGHLGTPFKLFICGDFVVSVSSADVVLWGFQHRELEALAAQCVPLQFPQFRPPLCVHVDAAKPESEGERSAAPSVSLGSNVACHRASPVPAMTGKNAVRLPLQPLAPKSAQSDLFDCMRVSEAERERGHQCHPTEPFVVVSCSSLPQATISCSSQSAPLHPEACQRVSGDSETNAHSSQRGAPGSEPETTERGRPSASADSAGRMESEVAHVEVIEPGDTSRLLQLRHIVGATVANSRGGCIWRSQQGLLCHAVGDWVLVERLNARSRCDSEGQCLGLLPTPSSAPPSVAEDGAYGVLWRRASGPLFRDSSGGFARQTRSRETPNPVRFLPSNRKFSAQGAGAIQPRSRGREAAQRCYTRCLSPLQYNTPPRAGSRSRKDAKGFCGFAGDKDRAELDRFGVCRDARLGAVLTMAMNQKGTLLATIHTKTVSDVGIPRRHSCASSNCKRVFCASRFLSILDEGRVQHEGPKDERTGEDEESVDKLLVVWRLEDCTIARLTVLPRSWYSDQVSREDVAEPGKPIPPALAFCGAEYLIVAKRSHSLFSAGMRGCARSFLSGASSRPHLDIYLVSDFLKVAPDLSSLPAPRHQPAPLVGTAVDVPVVRLLTCARTEDVEVVYISPRSTIFWKIDALHSLHGGEGQCPCKMECAEGRRFGCEVRANSSRECDDSAFDVDHRLALHFQFAELPWRMTDDPDLCFTTGCLTRRSASSPTLLLLATNAGFVYGVNFDTNTLLFELQVATAEPVTCIACDRAQDLLCGLGSTLKRWSVNLLSLLPT
ncbi:hypothetical protein NCLIV_022630 [Neospora caninum Liverpool]|uniref:CFA20 domain-containing protein n=1 Tax=Neospora caninum (strain Liverpool) TaxID=572307 RepID=F0VFI0_NEOCL|nr:hypothetical protein NCLIV_022630 [Neospora caninum Liverpool]CBZ52474.1 hypothetical protein NCLIV_022630 [Neospora caninum Liverpool]|eukprot:XP_003882506.1 hypothetical protein NCLIV_022630 [Neospora caninum Liverpool]